MSGRRIRRACDLTGCSHGAHGAGPVHIPGAIERRSKQGGSCIRRREGSHGSSSPARGAHAVARRRDGVAELATVDDRAAARPGRRRRLLDLHLHQLAAHTPLRPGLGDRRTPSDGLVVIGVHTPEFGFEHDVDNVRRAVEGDGRRVPGRRRQRLRASGRRSPTTTGRPCTSSTRDGQIRHHHFGEGEYEQSEQVIQQLLATPGAKATADDPPSRRPRHRDRSGLGQPRFARDLRRLRARASSSRPRAASHTTNATCTRCPRSSDATSGRSRGNWTIGAGAGRVTRTERGASGTASTLGTLHLILGTAAAGSARSVPREDRRRAARRCARNRCGR